MEKVQEKSLVKSSKNAITFEPSGKYFFGVGRRKRATATVRVYEKGSGIIFVNGMPFNKYFVHYNFHTVIKAPLQTTGKVDNHDIEVRVTGGGKNGQADSIRLGISRALLIMDITLRDTLKKQGFLRRDPRKKERKKPGLKRARRAPQWSKR